MIKTPIAIAATAAVGLNRRWDNRTVAQLQHVESADIVPRGPLAAWREERGSNFANFNRRNVDG
jgi:hypothetical protein